MRFFEERQGAIVWEGFGDFQHSNVHKQVAISFKTPKYRTLDIEQSIKVCLISFFIAEIEKKKTLKIIST